MIDMTARQMGSSLMLALLLNSLDLSAFDGTCALKRSPSFLQIPPCNFTPMLLSELSCIICHSDKMFISIRPMDSEPVIVIQDYRCGHDSIVPWE